VPLQRRDDVHALAVLAHERVERRPAVDGDERIDEQQRVGRGVRDAADVTRPVIDAVGCRPGPPRRMWRGPPPEAGRQLHQFHMRERMA
jgi:hypothetical protein